MEIYIKRALKAGILILSVYYLLSLLWLFSKQITYPYEIDWIEGGMLTSVMQILDGHNFYAAPSVTYVRQAIPVMVTRVRSPYFAV